MIQPRTGWRLPLALAGLAVSAPAAAAPWWYAGHDVDRAVFVDVGSIERDHAIVRFSAKQVIRRAGDPVAMTVSFLQADCARALIGWGGIQRFGADDAVIDTSTRPKAEMAPASTPIDRAQLDFVCADTREREAAGFFPLGIDDATFTEALLGEDADGLSPRALHDRLAASPATAVIRSTAPSPATFGTVQTVALGQPLVPPRDYGKGAQVPDPRDYPANEVGRIYDVAYQGIKDGEIRFEIRGYSIDDLAHPGSGQIETVRVGEAKARIGDLAITIREALPDRITYSIVLEKRPPPETP
ncbi:hypothetical protein [Sphingomonas hengshuiensis]|uniref:hypothetical protein n=1 Tax=Sphingomonas hengshuiensis TaxID=1609977 RepID=UPI000697965B|nr:hypothetical protein [Sphingomonas hengshuiensis]